MIIFQSLIFMHKNLSFLFYKNLLFAILFWTFSCTVFADTLTKNTNPKNEISTDKTAVPATFSQELAQFEDNILAVISFHPKNGWHSYANQSGSDFALPTTISLKTPNDKALQIFYPTGKSSIDQVTQTTVNIYETPTLFFIVIPQKIITEKYEITATIDMLLCSNARCLPLRNNFSFLLSPDMQLEKAQDRPWWDTWLSISSQKTTEHLNAAPPTFIPQSFTPTLEIQSLWKAVLFAFLAGFILNFMPCVLPVITLKLHSLLSAGEHSYVKNVHNFRLHNFFFALGILIYFSILAILVALTGMIWGEIFQNPFVLISLTIIVFALGLSLFDIYNLPILNLKHSVSEYPALDSFLTGILATLLATPCSGPFLGGVLAWGLLQPPLTIFLIFLCIGLGMATPYLLLSVRPKLIYFLPAPGNWTVILEQILGFFLLATCVYLLTLLPNDKLPQTLILLWCTGFALWIWGKFTSLSQSFLKRLTIRGLALAFIVGVGFFIFKPDNAKIFWQPFENKNFQEILGKKNIIIDFTADWCPNCKALEKTVFTPKILAKIEKKYDAAFLQVDLTRNEKNKLDFLKKMGSRSIPVVALFSAKDPLHPLILRDLFSKQQLLEALKQNFEKRNPKT